MLTSASFTLDSPLNGLSHVLTPSVLHPLTPVFHVPDRSPRLFLYPVVNFAATSVLVHFPVLY